MLCLMQRLLMTYLSEFQRKVLYLLMDVRREIQNLRNQIEEEDNELRLLESMNEVYDLEEEIQDKEAKAELVRNIQAVPIKC